MLIYLSGAINGVVRSEATQWREGASQDLNRLGISTFDPAAAFRVVEGSANTFMGGDGFKVMEIDRAAIENCDGMFVNLRGNGRMFGTIREIEFARSMDKKIVVLVDSYLESMWATDIRQVTEYIRAISEIVGWNA